MNVKKLACTAVASVLLLGTMIVPAFASTTFHATDQASLVSDIATATSGDTIVLDNGFALTSEIAINKSITIDGNNQTLTPIFSKTSSSNNSTFGIIGSDVTIKDLTIDGTNGTSLHGINVYEATNVNLDNVTLENNDRNGLVVNGSTVTVDNLTTSNNGWGGVDVDLGSGVPGPATLTVNGVSHHNEAYGKDLYIDNTLKNVSIVDTNSQYVTADSVFVTGDRVYTLEPTDMNQCKNNGWQSFVHPTFRNQGDCVSFVQSNPHAVGNKTR